ncbi:MAG: DUF4365 domain-containing protein [Gemmataceae bacterium]
MPNSNPNWFVADRSAVLAKLLLIARGGVRVRTQRELDDGADMLVEIDSDAGLSTRMFVVQVRGTLSSDPSDWTQTMTRFFEVNGQPAFLPVCAFVINVRDDQALYAWIVEPVVRATGPSLWNHSAVKFQSLDEGAAAAILDQVAAWYAARARLLQPA